MPFIAGVMLLDEANSTEPVDPRKAKVSGVAVLVASVMSAETWV